MTEDFPFEKFFKVDSDSKNNKNKDLLDSIFQQETTSEAVKMPVVDTNEDELAPLIAGVEGILKSKITETKYETFIKGKLKLSQLTENKAVFTVPTQFIKSTLETSFHQALSASLEELMGSAYDVSVEVSSSNPSESLKKLGGYSDSAIRKSDKKSTFTLDLTPEKSDLKKEAQSRFIEHMDPASTSQAIDPNKQFDNFIVGPSNNLAFATACAVADSPGKTGKYPCLYIYSDSGLGKTHLLHGVANGIHEKHPNLTICLITARDFMKELINAFKDQNLSEFQRKYTEKVDVLMIDDIHELKNKSSTQEEFFHIFNFLHDKGKQLIFTSDKSPDKINGIEERIITRLQWGLVVDIQKPDFETRTAILKKKAIELDLFIQDEVLNLIASSIKTSIRELEGSLIRLQAHAELMESEIDTEMARSILKLSEINERPAATLESVCRASAQYHKIAVPDLRSKSRNKEYVKARHIAWYLSYHFVGSTYKEIAKYYSNRDHSSVIHGVNKISDNLKNDPNLSKDLIFLENNI
ncbi:MAG: chromosomal replication initiator protein DnaA [Halobacteriovoraceae bacterium]|nr:chromosomal replication initiator protein DnaA [Halobacteriovoraceae bacterium]